MLNMLTTVNPYDANKFTFMYVDINLIFYAPATSWCIEILNYFISVQSLCKIRENPMT